jgi:hypothetical protein
MRKGERNRVWRGNGRIGKGRVECLITRDLKAVLPKTPEASVNELLM